MGGLLGALCGLLTSVEVGRERRARGQGGGRRRRPVDPRRGHPLRLPAVRHPRQGRLDRRFSVAHGITGAEVWTAALFLMAVFEVVLRTGVLAWLGAAVRRRLAPRPLFAGSSLSAGGSIMGDGDAAS